MKKTNKEKTIRECLSEEEIIEFKEAHYEMLEGRGDDGAIEKIVNKWLDMTYEEYDRRVEFVYSVLTFEREITRLKNIFITDEKMNPNEIFYFDLYTTEDTNQLILDKTIYRITDDGKHRFYIDARIFNPKITAWWFEWMKKTPNMEEDINYLLTEYEYEPEESIIAFSPLFMEEAVNYLIREKKTEL